MTLMDNAIGVPFAEKARLIELAQDGDRTAFTILFQCYHPRICTYLGRLVENEEIGRGQVCAMNAQSGQKVWRWTATRYDAFVVSLVAADHHLYFLYTDGDYAQVELYALNTSNGAQVWKYAFTSNYPYGGYFAVGN